MTSSKFYDYIIVGAGAAGLQLSLAFIGDAFFSKKRILLLDSNRKQSNDKTFSFWEEGNGKWDDIVSKKWNSAVCISPDNDKITFDLGTYQYKTIRAIDFYSKSLQRINASSNISVLFEDVLEVNEVDEGIVVVKTNHQAFKASKVFDSRIPISIDEIKKRSTYVNQSFLGFKIEMPEDVFDEKQCTMMDYSHQWEGSTSFMYILPFSKRKALFEYTFFAPFTPSKEIFKKQICSYLEKKYPGVNYEILETEYGEIPMTDFDFTPFNTQNHIRIGTAGGWVKPSSGYAFKAMEAYVTKNLLALKQTGIKLDKPKRYHFYDSLLLNILKYDNHIGGKLFFEMYKRPKIDLLFKFLDEKTTFLEELKLILQLPYLPFIKALFRRK